jgi:hypothetical protein
MEQRPTGQPGRSCRVLDDLQHGDDRGGPGPDAPNWLGMRVLMIHRAGASMCEKLRQKTRPDRAVSPQPAYRAQNNEEHRARPRFSPPILWVLLMCPQGQC